MLVALKLFGIDLTSIAVVFTALSVGIGFGLQYIAADIVSGFILLFERPIRVGDRITIGEDEGEVQVVSSSEMPRHSKPWSRMLPAPA